MNDKLTSFFQSYKIMEKIADKQKHLLKRSFKLFSLCFIFQGITFGLFFPLIYSMFGGEFILSNTLLWLGLIFITGLISLTFQYKALDFGFSEQLTKVIHNIRLKLGDKIKTIPLQKLNKYRTGEINSILGQAVDESVLPIGSIAGIALEVLVTPLMVLLIIFFIDLKMALAIIIATFISVPIYRWSRKLSKKERKDNRQAHSLLEADIIEYLQGLAVLKSINQVGENSKRLQNSIANVRQSQKKGNIRSSIPKVIVNTLIEFVFLLILSLGAIWIAKGEFNILELIILLVIIYRINEPLAKFLPISGSLDIMEVGFKKIQELLNIKALKINEPKAMPKEYDIVFKNVDFNYLGSYNKALNKLNLTIPSNAMTAIVGASGSGKTTITKLIMRYDDPSCGSVKIGGVDIRNISQDQLMSLVSVVFQDVYLFDDTILNNIKMGNPNASDEEIIKASKKAYCHGFITKLPDGYKTKIGEIGGALSGGERQRISIARAILKDAPIVILDEPTSALDTGSELAVQKALDKLIQNKTVIVIAHRLSTISHANNILVVDAGEINESGTHKELINKQGKYYSMFEAQQRIKQWSLV